MITGGSRGIGRALASELARRGHDLVLAADDDVETAAEQLARLGVHATPACVDLATTVGVADLATLVVAVGSPDVLVLNAGRAVGGRFLETDLEDHLRLLALDVTGLVHLARLVLPTMVAAGRGRVLVTSALDASLPGPYASTYGASTAFVASFGHALGVELEDTGVTVTVLRAGLTETGLFDRGGMRDTRVGQTLKQDPARVAAAACDALFAGRPEVVPAPLAARLSAALAGTLGPRTRARLRGATTKPRSSGLRELG